MKTKKQIERLPGVEVEVSMEDAISFLSTLQGRVNYTIDECLEKDPPIYHMIELIKEQQKLQLIINYFQKVQAPNP